MRRQQFPSMQVDILASHPAALAHTAAGFGILTRICFHFWMTECRPLPLDDGELFSIGRAHRPTWRRHKSNILNILSDVMPELERAWTSRRNRRDNLSRLAQRSASMRALNAGQKDTQSSTPKSTASSTAIGAGFAPKRTETSRAAEKSRPPTKAKLPGFFSD